MICHLQENVQWERNGQCPEGDGVYCPDPQAKFYIKTQDFQQGAWDEKALDENDIPGTVLNNLNKYL